MTHSDADPQPDRTSGLEPGGSVPPGETPPAEASTTPGVTQHQPDLPSRTSNKVAYGLIIAVIVVVALMFVGYAVGLIG